MGIHSTTRERIGRWRERVLLWAERAEKFSREGRQAEAANAEQRVRLNAAKLAELLADFVEESTGERFEEPVHPAAR